MTAGQRDFHTKYGPWAVVAGASEGVGSLLAEQLAARGLSLVLVARTASKLEAVASRIREATPVQTKVVSLDLSTSGAAEQLAEATAGLDVGLFIYCAGADADYVPFLANSADAAEAMVFRNCTVPVRLAHQFAGPMAERGRGGIILFCSLAGFFGAPNMAAYSASKAFDMVLAEGLWAELAPRGVDVLGLVLGETDTPALRRLLHLRGLASSADEPVRGAARPDDVVADALDYLGRGPTRVVGARMRLGMRVLSMMSRRRAVGFVITASERAMGKGAK